MQDAIVRSDPHLSRLYVPVAGGDARQSQASPGWRGSPLNRPANSLPTMSDSPTIFVIDDDPEMPRLFDNPLRIRGWRTETLVSAEAFLSRPRLRVPSCLVIDAHIGGNRAIEVQRRVAADRPETPVIFISDRCDLPTAVQAIKAGAMEFFMKPVSEDELTRGIQQAIDASRHALEREAGLQALRTSYAVLSAREREVMTLVVGGRLNKQIGGDLGISEITVKAHRGQVMRKMGAGSLAELVQMAVFLGILNGRAGSRLEGAAAMARLS